MSGRDTFFFNTFLVVAILVGEVRRTPVLGAVVAVETGAFVVGLANEETREVVVVLFLATEGVPVEDTFLEGASATVDAGARRALAAVGAVNLETSDRVEPAFFGFVSGLSSAAAAGGAFLFANKATLGTRAGLVVVVISVVSVATGFLRVVVTGFLIPTSFVNPGLVSGFLRVEGFLS